MCQMKKIPEENKELRECALQDSKGERRQDQLLLAEDKGLY